MIQTNGEEGKICFWKNDKVISFEKHGMLILNPFALDFKNRKIQLKLVQEMKEIANDYCNENRFSIQREIIGFMDEMSKHISYNISYEECIDAELIFKMLGVQLNYSEDSFACKIISYVKILYQLCGIEVFVFINISQFITKQEFASLVKDLNYLNIYVLYIELCIRNEFENAIIVDTDLCVIQKDEDLHHITDMSVR